jgi:hypothetical protein
MAFIKVISRFSLVELNKTKTKTHSEQWMLQIRIGKSLQKQNFLFFNEINFLFVMGLFN